MPRLRPLPERICQLVSGDIHRFVVFLVRCESAFDSAVGETQGVGRPRESGKVSADAESGADILVARTSPFSGDCDRVAGHVRRRRAHLARRCGQPRRSRTAVARSRPVGRRRRGRRTPRHDPSAARARRIGSAGRCTTGGIWSAGAAHGCYAAHLGCRNPFVTRSTSNRQHEPPNGRSAA